MVDLPKKKLRNMTRGVFKLYAFFISVTEAIRQTVGLIILLAICILYKDICNQC